MSAREMALLKDLSSTVPEVILVLNKIDFLSRDELDRMIRRTAQQIPHRVDANCGRVRFDLIRRLKDSAQRFMGRMGRLVDQAALDIRRAAEEAMDLKSAAQDRLEERGRELTHLLRQLEEIEREISPRD